MSQAIKKDHNRLFFVPLRDRERVLEAVQKDGNALEYASEELQNDREIVLAAVKEDARALAYASPELRGDSDILLAVKQDGRSNTDTAAVARTLAINAGPELAPEPGFMVSSHASADTCTTPRADDGPGPSPELSDKRDYKEQKKTPSERRVVRNKPKRTARETAAKSQISRPRLKKDHNQLFFTPLRDRERVLEAVQKDGNALEYASEELQNDREIVLAAVKQDARALAYASTEFQGDSEIVLAAVKQDGSALAHASCELKCDRAFMLEVVKQDWRLFESVSDDLKYDVDIVLQAVNKYFGGEQEIMYEEATKEHQGTSLDDALETNGMLGETAAPQSKQGLARPACLDLDGEDSDSEYSEDSSLSDDELEPLEEVEVCHIYAEMHLDINFHELAGDPSKRNEFERQFKEDLARQLGCDPDQIILDDVAPAGLSL